MLTTPSSTKELSNGKCGIFVYQNGGNLFMTVQCENPDDYFKGGTSIILG